MRMHARLFLFLKQLLVIVKVWRRASLAQRRHVARPGSYDRRDCWWNLAGCYGTGVLVNANSSL